MASNEPSLFKSDKGDHGDDSARSGWFEEVYGKSDGMRRVFDAIERVATTDAPVLIVGESGSGKELVAHAIHARSARRSGVFVPVHAGAIPKDLVVSEMFGHERGAFTGATAAADGKFAAAAGGSIFLDEIATMTTDVQVVLLRVLETMRFTRVGGHKEQPADVRVIAASNRDLRGLVGEGSFREDLYFRIAVFTIALPPLRERVEDIGPLAMQFLQTFAARHGSAARRLSRDALAALEAHSWPGNVRELRNVIERAVVFASSAEVDVSDLQIEGPARNESRPRLRTSTLRELAGGVDHMVIPVGTSMRDVEREVITRTLAYHGGNKLQAARTLGISRRSIYNRLREYALLDAWPDADDGGHEDDDEDTAH